MKLFIQTCLTITLLLIFVGSANAGFQINTTDRGWYDPLGDHITNNENYVAGQFNMGPPLGFDIAHDFFVIDLSSVDTPVCTANLHLFNPSIGFVSPNPPETFSIFDVTTDIAMLIGGTAGVAGYNDLGTGVSFGSTIVSADDNDQFVTVILNNDGINAINAAAGGLIAFGGALTTITQAIQSEFVLGNTGNHQDGDTFLEIQFVGCPEPPSGPIVIIPTMSQWGMIFASIIIGIFAVIALRRRTES